MAAANRTKIPGDSIDPDALALRFGRALRRARGSVTQVQLAALSGVEQSTISIVERGGRLPTIEQVARFEIALGLARGALFEAGYAEVTHSTLDAIAVDASLHPVAREALRLAYVGLQQMPEVD